MQTAASVDCRREAAARPSEYQHQRRPMGHWHPALHLCRLALDIGLVRSLQLELARTRSAEDDHDPVVLVSHLVCV